MIYIVGQNLRLDELLTELACCKARAVVVGLDTETEGINPKKEAASAGLGRIVCWSISTPKYPRVFLWAEHLEALKSWLEDPEALKVGHNIFGFDKHMFANHGIKLLGVAACTLRLSRLLYSCKLRNHGLKALALHWLGIEQPSFASLFTRPRSHMEELNPKKTKKGVVEYLDYLETHRKVGEHKRVPTLIAKGPIGRISPAAREFIPLSTIPTHYPGRLQALFDYATLDAELTRLLYIELMGALESVPWKVYK